MTPVRCGWQAVASLQLLFFSRGGPVVPIFSPESLVPKKRYVNSGPLVQLPSLGRVAFFQAALQQQALMQADPQMAMQMQVLWQQQAQQVRPCGAKQPVPLPPVDPVLRKQFGVRLDALLSTHGSSREREISSPALSFFFLLLFLCPHCFGRLSCRLQT